MALRGSQRLHLRLSPVALVLGALVGVAVAFAPPTSAAPSGSAAVIVVPRFDPQAYADRGAVGLLVPGAGSTVSRERALASLVSGRVVSSLVDLDGKPSLQLATTPAETTIYVSLPPPGPSHNVVRYPVAIVGPGYDGLLTSASTRIDGLISLADIAPTAAAIAAGTAPKIRSRPDPQAAATLARLDRDLSRAHDARTGATIVLVAWLVAFSSLGILGGSALAGRAAVLVAPVALAAAIVLRAVGLDDPTVVIIALAVSVGLGAFLLGLRPEVLVPADRRPPLALPPDPRGLARGQCARCDRAAPGRRRPLLRDHEPGEHAAPRAVPRGGNARGGDGGGRDRPAAPRHRRVEPSRCGRGRRARRRQPRSPSCSRE